MKNFIFMLSALVMLVQIVKAQQSVSYHVYVIATSGKVVNKTYQNAQELNRDQTLRDLHVGYLKGKEFVFTPDENKHKAFFVERKEENDTERHFQFHAWDGQAARQIAMATNIYSAPARQPVQIQQERISDATVKPEKKKGFEEEILQELMKDGIIKKDDRKVSIILTRTALIVNSKKQPEQVLSKYKTLAESIRSKPLSENYRFEYTSEVDF